MSDREKFLNEMRQAGITLLGSVEAPWGGIECSLEPEDVVPYMEDRAAWFARKNGAFRYQYVDWLETFGEPRCGATTSTGEGCKNRVSGGIQKPFEEWLQLDGGFCKVHGGPGSKTK